MDNANDTSTDWATFRRRCLKPDPDRLGSWTARRLGRPAALRVTRVVAPWGVTANHATSAAMLSVLAAVVAFGFGTASGWLIGSLLLPLWYLLDHVDGQLARWNRTASLDGTTVDYLMHHSVNMLLPIGLGFGLMRETGYSLWCIAGIVWGWSALIIGLRHDARYKAFVQRLKILHGELRVVGGGGGRPEVAAMPRRSLLGITKWLVLKAYEAHVMMFVLLGLGIIRMFFAELGLIIAEVYVGAMALLAPFLAVLLVLKGFKDDESEREFSAWYHVRETDMLEFRHGWWYVEPVNGPLAQAAPATTFDKIAEMESSTYNVDAGISS